MGDVTGDTGGWLHRSTTMLAKTLNKSEVVLRNRALDPRGLESPGPIFKTLILSLVSFPQTVRLTTFDPYLLCWPQQPINVHSTQFLSKCWGRNKSPCRENGPTATIDGRRHILFFSPEWHQLWLKEKMNLNMWNLNKRGTLLYARRKLVGKGEMEASI